MTPPVPSPSLTVLCAQGLANRLRVLLSGMALAEASGRRFRMLWPETHACAAPFGELFDNPWPVEAGTPGELAQVPAIRGWLDALPDLLAPEPAHFTFSYPGWLIQPERFPHQASLLPRVHALANELSPVAPLREAMANFRRDHFRPTMIGVHLRRGDMLRERPDGTGTTAAAMAAVDGYLEGHPEAGILLCSDDGAVDPRSGRQRPPEGVHRQFRRRYGERVVWTSPRSLDRSTRVAVEDAVVDLWLLRATHCFVGTQVSSFSDFVLVGRDCPNTQLFAPRADYRRWETLARWSGLYLGAVAYGRHLAGRELPFPVALRHLLAGPRRWTKRTLQQRTPVLYTLLRRLKQGGRG